ncbi:MAG: hypothetical protein ACOVSV_05755 [Fimbriimonadaceae bacterium]
MPTFYSDQITGLRATPQSKPDSGVSNGKVRVQAFSWTGDAAQNDLVELVRLPVGARIITGFVDFTDFGTSVTLDIGDGTTENKYLSASDVATAAGTSDFANTWARYGLGRERLSVVTTLTAKFEAANPDSGSLRGYVLYAVD